ncbi:MAG: type II toxin-antitoxin system VapC family toxin [Deltaproteobacteria bacterium]|nr:type II toxin-antitoxin system VapC family toxin [Deltaproteobacteria bacterium]
MLILDTCALVFDSLDPLRLSKKAAAAIAQAHDAGTLACCDISLWEIAMLVAKRRLDPGTDSQKFIQLILAARNIKVLPITAEIAAKSAQPEFCPHGDPADRIIAASTVLHKSKLVTSDRKLAAVAGLQIVW